MPNFLHEKDLNNFASIYYSEFKTNAHRENNSIILKTATECTIQTIEAINSLKQAIEKSSEQSAKMSSKIVCLTWVLAVSTAVLAFVGFARLF